MANVLILGATSAIATEVARLYARRGDRLHLIGRDPDKLRATAARCTGGTVTTQTADFNELSQNDALISSAINVLGTVDTVLIAHGLLSDQLLTEQSFEAAELSLRTNLMSVVSLLIPLVNALEKQGSGQLGVITSVAGERGRPRNYTYGTAKGALNLYLQGVRSRLYGSGVGITTVKLGPVDTPMTTSHTKNMLFATAEGVAVQLVAALDGRKNEVYVPQYWALIMFLVRNAPEALFQRLSFLSGR